MALFTVSEPKEPQTTTTNGLSSLSPKVGCDMKQMFGYCVSDVKANDPRIIYKSNSRNTDIP